MERNFLLALALSFVVLAVWTLYTGERRARLAEAQGTVVAEAPAVPQGGVPPGAEPGSLPPAVAPAPGSSPAAQPGRGEVPSAQPGVADARLAVQDEQRVRLETPLWEAEFTNRGGALLRWALLDYRDRERPGDPPVEITTHQAPRDLALATPLEGLGWGDLAEAPYTLVSQESDGLVYEYTREGVTVRKSYLFDPEDYHFRLRIEIENESDRHLRPTFRMIWPAHKRPETDYLEHSVAALSEGDLEQAPVGAGAGFLGFGGALETPLELRDVDWAGAHTRYFLAAMIPDVPRDASARLTPTPDPGVLLAEVAFVPVNVPPGQRIDREYRVYLGPKETERLAAVGSHLDEAVLKGWFPALTNLFVWLLAAVHRVIPNYGWTIVVLTILVRLLMWPIMSRQVKSMKRMGEMQPRMKAIQEKYADDRNKQSEEMMKLYKESGFNPLTGCLPMFLQLPVFIGLYYALQGSIQLRQAPFFAWINDLSQPEALFVIPGLEVPLRLLPILMGASMVLQQRITPTTMDPAQARMMGTVMPVMFTFLFYQFASGLVLYWFISNVLGIAQQVWTQRESGAKPAPKAAEAGESKPPPGRKSSA